LADRVFVLNPELARYVPGADFLPYASVDLDSLEPTPPRESDRLRIVHAPSDEGIKGSRLIAEAVERLQQRHPIDYTVVTGVPHEAAMELYRSADLVIDQVLAGWYGGLAVEAMALGKPVAAYIRDEDVAVVPADMRDELPIVRIRPDRIEDDLESAIAERRQWGEWGRRGRAFALRWHHPRTIAAALLRVYDDPSTSLRLR
jgi:glycosyltransferase involved in cell wall biosynthesis